MIESESSSTRAKRHAELYRVALRETLRRWGRNRTRDEIEDAVAEAYRMELTRQVNKNLDLDDASGYWIMRKAVHLLTGKCASRSRGVLCSASRAVSVRDNDGRMLEPHEWVDMMFHSSLQSTADAIESGWIEHVDLKVRTERLLAGSDAINSASDAFRILIDAGYSTSEIAACLDNAGGTLSRQATNLWKHSGRVPLVYQEQLIALVGNPSPLQEQRRQAAYTVPDAAQVGAGRVAASTPASSHHGAHGSRGGVIVRASSRPRT
jgi:hypothetical protein